MLLGSAAFGALALGDAPPASLFLAPIVLRRPSGHNIGVSGGPISPAVFVGTLAEIPPQLNEPGVTLYFAGGNTNLANSALVFVKPSGAAYSVGAPLIYIGRPQVTFGLGTFPPNRYIVYTFGQTELDELGTWQVQVWKGEGGASPIGSFVVGRAPTPAPSFPILPPHPGPIPPGPTPIPTPGQFVFITSPTTFYALPPNPTIDQLITVVDSSGTATASPITVSGNGNLINGLPNFVINQNHASYGFVWDGAQWHIV
jgi:hypothetical protein